MDLAHPFGVTLGQVVVDRDHMHPPARQGVEVAGQHGHQRLAFAGFHFGDPALMQDDAAHELHRIGPHPQHPVGGLPHGGKGLGQQVVQRFAAFQPLFELVGFCLKLLVGESLVFRLQRQNFVHRGLNFLDFPVRPGAKQFCKKSHCNLLVFAVAY